ncbi:FtsX-like permease family protein [Demequina sp. NBRC 110054]|uniref:FtsX-like permease family protein n=1 Tax=Demequina sp. NBRC 110054 TaxID=1570343 RepID=UPI0013567305|nr:FtsX-like permease family protein [Demequina sp. NBRC 110054]
MIGQLMRENLRAHRTYLFWTTALLALTIGLTSYVALTAAQHSTVADYVAEAHGVHGSWRTQVAVGDPDTDGAGDAEVITRDQLAELLEQATAEGAGVSARTEILLTLGSELETATYVSSDSADWNTTATTGAVDWDTLLLTGDAPATGEIVVDAAWAEDNGIAVGDALTAGTLSAYDLDGSVPLSTLTVSGLLRTPVVGEYEVWQEQAIINWDTALDLAEVAAVAGSPESGTLQAVSLYAERETPALATVTRTAVWDPYDATIAYGVEYYALAAGVLVVGLIGMAFAVGRSQAQQRVRWVATARVLGTRRATIAAATVTETVAWGTLAGVAGLLGAYAVTALQWEALVAANPEALLPAHLSLPVWVVLGLVALGVLLAAIIGAIPAFWSARVAPTAALTAVTPVSSVPVSRTAPLWPLLALWTVCSAGTLLGVHGTPGDAGWSVRVAEAPGMGVVAVVTYICAGVVTTMLVVELVRRAVAAVAVRLSRARRPWALTAGSALLARPALASAPAAVFALATTVGSGFATYLALYVWAYDTQAGTSSADPAVPFLGPFAFPSMGASLSTGYGTQARVTALVAGLLALAALAAFVSSRSAHTDEDRAAAAMGLDAHAARRAAALQFGGPLALGTLLGGLIGPCLAAALFSYDYVLHDAAWNVTALAHVGPTWAFAHLSHATLPAALILTVMLACVAAGAAIVAATTRVAARPLERTPA